MALKLHIAETNWPSDLITGYNDADPMATLMNTYESIILGANRIGHGLGFIKHPYLLSVIKERNVAIESCVVSNQILGYMADLRNHPAVNYIKQGIPVVLGSDDPGTFGYDDFTIDWYEAFMAWGLDLIDLRNLALDSLRHSSMTTEESDAAIEEKWRPQWNAFISDVYGEACNSTALTSTPFFGSILPQEGEMNSATRVHVFGRHFEEAICSVIVCRFGDMDVTGENVYYVSNNHIICVTPIVGTPDGASFPLELSFDGGATFYDTGFSYIFRYGLELTTPAMDVSPTDSSGKDQFSVSFVVALLGVLFLFRDY